jgi:hypothetical protein
MYIPVVAWWRVCGLWRRSKNKNKNKKIGDLQPDLNHVKRRMLVLCVAVSVCDMALSAAMHAFGSRL